MAGKKILILGNGFDLAHDFPTRYGDFLERCKTRSFQKMLPQIKNNIWIEYFKEIYDENGIKEENWVDFESEMSIIIRFIDKSSENLLREYDTLFPGTKHIESEKKDDYEKMKKFDENLFKICKAENHRKFIPPNAKYYFKMPIKNLRKRCFEDLERLIYALEQYLIEVAEKKDADKLSIIENIHPDYIINFNYTHTYERLYNDKIPVFHIHGECGKKENNMVLGIDEYWTDEECDNHTNFAIFKKFVQRVQQKTGTTHIKWLNEIHKIYQAENEMSDIYTFGHSLDITDKDILQGFFTSDATRIHIYCKDKKMKVN